MKLLISFFVALAILLLVALVATALGEFVKKFGYGALDDCFIVCCMIVALTFLVYSLWGWRLDI